MNARPLAGSGEAKVPRKVSAKAVAGAVARPGSAGWPNRCQGAMEPIGAGRRPASWAAGGATGSTGPATASHTSRASNHAQTAASRAASSHGGAEERANWRIIGADSADISGYLRKARAI